MIIGETFDPFKSINTPHRCFKGGGKPKMPPPTPVPQEAEANAAKRDVLESNLRRKGRTASQVLSPGLLLTAPQLSMPMLKEKLG